MMSAGVTRWSGGYVSVVSDSLRPLLQVFPFSPGFLAAELSKAGIEPHPAGSVEAPDPQKMIDLEVCCYSTPSSNAYSLLSPAHTFFVYAHKISSYLHTSPLFLTLTSFPCP